MDLIRGTYYYFFSHAERDKTLDINIEEQVPVFRSFRNKFFMLSACVQCFFLHLPNFSTFDLFSHNVGKLNNIYGQK